jgi:hypothetical protein
LQSNANALLDRISNKESTWATPLKAAQPLSVGAVWLVQRVKPEIEQLLALTARLERERAEQAARAAAERAEAERKAAAAKAAAEAEARRKRNILIAKISAVPAIALAAFITFQVHSYREQAADETAWMQAQQANSIEAYRTYLGGSKLGTFESQAEAAIASLDRPRDDADWQRARSLHSVDGYRTYTNPPKD